MARRCAWLLAVVVLAWSGAATAQVAAGADCLGVDPRTREYDAPAVLAACQRFIDEGGDPALVARAHMARANAWDRLRRDTERRADSDAAVRTAPGFAPALLARAYWRLLDDRHAAAIEDLRAGMALEPRASGLYHRFADQMGATRNWRAQDLYLSAALEAEPADVETRLNRASARDHVGDYAGALADYAVLLRADPRSARVLTERGAARNQAGDFAAAEADLDSAIALADAEYRPRYLRGHARWALGRFAEAREDFRAALRLDAGHLFSWAWLFVAEDRIGGSASDEQRALAAKQNLATWPGPIVEFFLGRLDARGVLAAAEQNDDLATRERLCEAYFFLGQHLVTRGDTVRAAQLLEAAVGTGVTYFIEHYQARVELARLRR